MKKLKYLLIIIVTITSCSLFKKTTKTTSENNQKSNSERNFSKEETSYLTKKGMTISNNNDRIASDYTIRFWPKGDLSFTPSGGFNGNFDSILVKGKVFKANNSSQITYIDVNRLTDKNIKLQSVNSTITQGKNVVKSSSVDMKWILIATSVILLILFLWLNRFKLYRFFVHYFDR